MSPQTNAGEIASAFDGRDLAEPAGAILPFRPRQFAAELNPEILQLAHQCFSFREFALGLTDADPGMDRKRLCRFLRLCCNLVALPCPASPAAWR